MQTPRLVWNRMLLGQVQMAGAVAALLLLVTGAEWPALIVVYLTAFASLASLVRFRGPQDETWHTRARKAAAELAGTFGLVLAVSGVEALYRQGGSTASPLSAATALAFATAATILATGRFSGAHLNPAVTLVFFVSGRFDRHLAHQYILSQILGAFTATLLLSGLVGSRSVMVVACPVPDWMCLSVEALFSCSVMIVILLVSRRAEIRGMVTAVCISAVAWIGALFASSVSGAWLNPARSLAASLVSPEASNRSWIVLAAQIAGGLFAVVLCRGLRGQTCCGSPGRCQLFEVNHSPSSN